MEGFILNAYEFLSVLLPAAAVLGVIWVRCRRQGGMRSIWYAVFVMVFAVYLFGVYHVTGAGTIFEAKRYGISFGADEVNLLPFSDPGWDPVGYGLNIALFVPFGFLMPLIWKRLNGYRYAVGYGLLFSVLIEASQLLNIRATDVDDIILNTAGAVLGMLLFQMFSRLIKRGQKTEQESGFPYELPVYVGVTFLFRFLVFNEFGMAKLLYGF